MHPSILPFSFDIGICGFNESYDKSTCRDKVKQLVKLHKKIVGDISIQWKVFTRDACGVLFKLKEFKAAYGLKPQHVLDLVPLPQEARVSDEGEAFADQKVKLALKASNAAYCFAANKHQRLQEFKEGDLVLVHLWRERFPRGTYDKLKSMKFGSCKVLKKISSNAYAVELSADLQISPIFNVSDFYLEPVYKQASHLQKVQTDVIEDVMDVKEMTSKRGNQYRRILVKSV